MLMNDYHIAEQFDRLRAAYGERNFTPAHIARIKKYLSNTNVGEFAACVDYIIDNLRQPPLPKDFQTLLKKQRYIGDEEIFTTTNVHCLDCYDIGFLHCQLNISEPLTWVFCYCREGLHQESLRPESVMPKWDVAKMSDVYGFIKLQFPLKQFIPLDDLGPIRKQPALSWWLGQQQDAFKYWDDKVKPKEL